MKRLIVFLVRKRLGLMKHERFRFSNQRSDKNEYYFTEDKVMKICRDFGFDNHIPSSVSLNWLLNDKCEIERVVNKRD